MKAIAFVAFLGMAFPAFADSIAVTPQVPTSADTLAIEVHGMNSVSQTGVFFSNVVVQAGVIRLEGCINNFGFATGSDYYINFSVPNLEPGGYSIEYWRAYCDDAGHVVAPFQKTASASLIVLPALSAARPRLDTSFGANGLVALGFDGLGGSANRVLIQRDGKVMAIGNYFIDLHPPFPYIPLFRRVVARLQPDGSLDPSFDADGLYQILSTDAPLILQSDDKLLGVHQYDGGSSETTGLIRQNEDGSIDSMFPSNGSVGVAWSSPQNIHLALQADGKIALSAMVFGAVVPNKNIMLARFKSDGTLDLSFNLTGSVITSATGTDADPSAGLLVQPDGKLVVAATLRSVASTTTTSTTALIRYNADGSLDTSFGESGWAFADLGSAYAIVRQPGGRLIVAGGLDQYGLVLMAFRPDGRIDSAFGNNGITQSLTSGATSNRLGFGAIEVAADGSMLVAVTRQVSPFDSEILRVSVDGSLDTAFGNSGIVPTAMRVTSMALQPDGNFVLGGKSSSGDFAVARYISGPSAAIEFYNAARDHYFLSMNPQEVADLDLGVHAGWARTGQSFSVFGSAASAAGSSANPVCRFYIPPQHGDSHFFSADFRECQQVLSNMIYVPNFSGYIEETSNAFYVTLPDLLTGACPAATVPVYRLWNQRWDSNHRYTTSPAIRAQMVANGYVVEGYGLDPVDMCAPR